MILGLTAMVKLLWAVRCLWNQANGPHYVVTARPQHMFFEDKKRRYLEKEAVKDCLGNIGIDGEKY